MKKYTYDNLKLLLDFDIYYTGSLNGACLFPHIGHLLKEDIILNDEIIPKGYMLFYNRSENELEIMNPKEWSNDTRSCYRVNKERHNEHVQQWLCYTERTINV